MLAFKMSIYYKLKISYIIKLVIIKHAQVIEYNETLSAIWCIKPWLKCTFKY